MTTKSAVTSGCWVGDAAWTCSRELGVSLSGEAGLASLSQVGFCFCFLVLALEEKSVQQRPLS